MRYSRQNDILRQVIKDRKDHPTATTIYLDAKELEPNISLGTVYRNLNNMVENGEIQRIIIPNEADRFDPHVQSHSHLHCKKCNKLLDIDYMLSDDELKKLSKKYEMNIDRLWLLIDGICKNCGGEK